ncbi:MAG: hydrolase [Acidobacteria bacterium]|nr:MAG: hydrolase [Acidobacteriota bacterium]PYQ19995.1 MAG: hydrolase [Acidobacteriota bacterium]
MHETEAETRVGGREIVIPAGSVSLQGDLEVPETAHGVVLFAHGSGSSRHSRRNQFVARRLQEAGLATLLMDLLTPSEDEEDARTARLRFDMDLLARRLLAATDWLGEDPRIHDLPLGYFGASSGGGAALVAAAERPQVVKAVVSRGGRPDLAGEALPRVEAPTLLIVGSRDTSVITVNRQSLERLRCVKDLQIVPGASHLFEEPGTLEAVANLAAAWFVRHLGAAS